MSNTEREAFLKNDSRKYNNITVHDIFESGEGAEGSNIPWTVNFHP